MIRSFVLIGALCAATSALACDEESHSFLPKKDPAKELAEAIDRQTMEQRWANTNRDYELQKQRDAIDRQTDAILLDSVANGYPRY